MIPTEAVAEFSATADRLADALERETACLKAAAFQDLPALHGEKRALTAACEACFAEIRRQLADGAADPASREALAAATERLHRAAARNGRAIAAARAVTGRILEAVTRAAAAEETRNRGYGDALAARRPGAAALSIALDRRL